MCVFFFLWRSKIGTSAVTENMKYIQCGLSGNRVLYILQVKEDRRLHKVWWWRWRIFRWWRWCVYITKTKCSWLYNFPSGFFKNPTHKNKTHSMKKYTECTLFCCMCFTVKTENPRRGLMQNIESILLSLLWFLNCHFLANWRYYLYSIE